MKKYSLFLIVIFLISSVSSFQQVAAQEKTKAEQEKEAQLQQAIDEQKKALLDQKKARQRGSWQLRSRKPQQRT